MYLLELNKEIKEKEKGKKILQVESAPEHHRPYTSLI